MDAEQLSDQLTQQLNVNRASGFSRDGFHFNITSKIDHIYLPLSPDAFTLQLRNITLIMGIKTVCTTRQALALLEQAGYLSLANVLSAHRIIQAVLGSDRLVISYNGLGYTSKNGIEKEGFLFPIMTSNGFGFQGKIEVREMSGKDEERKMYSLYGRGHPSPKHQLVPYARSGGNN